MKKVGVITHYHDSMNYGAVLQAYAMCAVLEDLGFSGEQIRFSMEYVRKRTLTQTIRRLLSPSAVKGYLEYQIGDRWRKKKLTNRKHSFQDFNRQNIPSSERVYTVDSVSQCADRYDAFITGSDQVWNPDYYFAAFFLDFVPQGKKRISYAASVGKSALTPEQAERMARHLKGFSAVSVREQNAVALVQPLTELPVEHVLDPTLLMDQNHWDTICSEPLVDKPYVFCFFLGYDPAARRVAREYARSHGLQIVTIPHASSLYIRGGSTFGDQRFWDAAPSDFLSLVKHADCVFTDSFHACAFSTVFEKEFFVFRRAGMSGMSGRIESLLSVLSSLGHFCDSPDKQTLAYVEAQEPIAYEKAAPALAQLRSTSLAYLKRNL